MSEVSASAWPETAWTVAGIFGANCEVRRDDMYLVCAVPALGESRADDALVVGDRVLLNDALTSVATVLPRRSELVRMRVDRQRRSAFAEKKHVIAANIDVGVIVASKSNPAFHPRLIDRYLVMCQYGNVRPLICINKCDLEGPAPDLSIYHDIGLPIVFSSAVTGEGLRELQAAIHGCSSALVGQSGVGKSTIVNALLESRAAAVGEVSEKSGRGRHTTTVSSLYQLDADTYLFDTPGIRSWGLWKIGRESIKSYFPEFAAFAARCRYRNCKHSVEIDCAVREAVENGLIPSERYESYRRLLGE